MDICFVYVGENGTPQAHPVHQQWCAQIDADTITLEAPQLPGIINDSIISDVLLRSSGYEESNHDMYIFESPSALYTLPALERQNPDSMKLFLHTTWRLSGLQAYDWDGWSPAMKVVGGIDRTFASKLLDYYISQYIDGVITVSEMCQTQITERYQLPTEIIHPHISHEFAAHAESVDVDLNSPNVVTVSKSRDHKGTDLLVDAWPTVRKKFPEAQLRVIGPGHQKRYEQTEGVQVLGYVDSLIEELGKVSLAVHPARFDAFPVSTLETMRVGLPTIVTSRTGTKTIVREVSTEFVIEPTQDAIASAIIEYFKRPMTERQQLSESAKTVVDDLTEIEKKDGFESALLKLVGQM